MKVLNFRNFFTVLSPFPSCSKILFQSEAECEVIDVKMILYFHANKTFFFTGKVLHLASCTE